MKAIEKVTDDGNVMMFEKYSRKDLKEVVSIFFDDMLSLCSRKKDFEYFFGDSSIYWQLDDDSWGCITEDGLYGRRPPLSRITHLKADHGGNSIGFFQMEIVKNPHYGDWELSSPNF